MPDVGTLTTYSRPQGPGIRVDDGFEQGMEVPIYYDPMIAKLITYGRDREEARQRMLRAIEEYRITGVKTTLPFCHYVFGHQEFINGNFDTKFVEKYFAAEDLQTATPDEERVAALAAVWVATQSQQQQTAMQNGTTLSPWRQRSRYR